MSLPGLPEIPGTPPVSEEEEAVRVAMQTFRTTNAAALTNLENKWAAFRNIVRTTQDDAATAVTELKAAIDAVAALDRS